jgi:hypothetical protein
MEEHDEINKELKEIAPVLSRLPRSVSFSVDEGYFDALPTAVMNRIHSRKKKTGFNLAWLLQPRWAAATAMVLIALVAGSYFLLRQNSIVDQHMSTAQVQKLLVEPLTTENIIDELETDDMTDAIADVKQAPAPKIHVIKHDNKKELEELILDNLEDNSTFDEL